MIRDIVRDGPPKHLLETSAHLFNRPVDLSKDVWWVMDLDFRFAHVSEAVYNMRGLPASHVCNQKPGDYLSTPSLCRLIQTWSNEMKLEVNTRNSDIKVLQLDQLHANGHLISTEVVGCWIRESNGILVGAMGITRIIDTAISYNLDTFAAWANLQGIIPCHRTRTGLIPTEETIGELVERYQRETKDMK